MPEAAHEGVEAPNDPDQVVRPNLSTQPINAADYASQPIISPNLSTQKIMHQSQPINAAGFTSQPINASLPPRGGALESAEENCLNMGTNGCVPGCRRQLQNFRRDVSNPTKGDALVYNAILD